MQALDQATVWAMNNPGVVMEYARGYLPGIDSTPCKHEEARGIAQRLFESGLVELIQKREGPFDYRYLMIARCEPPLKSRLKFWATSKTGKYRARS